MESQTEEIKSRIDIVDFIAKYLQLKQTGQNWRGLCPFHHEKTPSFMVNRERQIYKCFGCGEGGDIFDFVQKIEALDFPDALKFLADRAGVTLKPRDPSRPIISTDSKVRLYKLNSTLAQLYHTLLMRHPLGKAALTYAKSRGLDDAILKKFLVGFAPRDTAKVKQFLTQRGFALRELADAGNPERFNNRLMFPIFDTVGNAVGFTGRSLEKDQEPKYLNTKETKIFHKAKVLYGFNVAKTAIRERGLGVLVEGQLDVVLSHQAGVLNAVATSGTALTEDHLLLLRRQTSRVILSFDNDSAGFKTTLKAIEMAWRLSLEVLVVTMPEGCKDAGDVVAKDATLWPEVVKGATPAFDWLWQNLSSKYDPATTAGKKQLTKIIAPIVAAAADAVEKDDYIQKLSRALGVSEAAIKESVGRLAAPSRAPESASSKSEEVSSKSPNEWLELLALLSLAPPQIGAAAEVLRGKLGRGQTAEVYETVFSWYDKHEPNLPPGGFLGVLPKSLAKDLQTRSLVWENLFTDHDTLQKDIDKRLARLAVRYRERIKSDFAAQIAAAEKAGDIARVKALVRELQSRTK